VRAAGAPRAGEAHVAGMQFVRLRTEMNQATPRACLEFSQNLSRDASIHYADYIRMDPAAPYSVDVSGNLLCLGGLPLNPERQVTVRQGLPSASGERTPIDETFTLTFGDRPALDGVSALPVDDGVGLDHVGALVRRAEQRHGQGPQRQATQHEDEADGECQIAELAGSSGDQLGKAGSFLDLHRYCFLNVSGQDTAGTVLKLIGLRLQLLQVVANRG
jgi:hypothetical protein